MPPNTAARADADQDAGRERSIELETIAVALATRRWAAEVSALEPSGVRSMSARKTMCRAIGAELLRRQPGGQPRFVGEFTIGHRRDGDGGGFVMARFEARR